MLQKAGIVLILILSLTGTHIHSQNDIELIDKYKKKCRENSNNADSLFYYSTLLLKIKDSSAQYEGYFAKAYAYRNNLKTDSAIVNFQKALEFAKLKQSKSRAIRMSLITAINDGKNDLALNYADQMFKLAHENNDSLLLAHAYNQRGIIFKEKGDLELAIKDYVNSSLIYENLKNPGIVNAHTNIAIAYDIIGQDSVSLKWFKKAYQEANTYQVTGLKIRATNNIANHYKTLKQYDSSRVYYNKLLKIEDELNTYYKTLLYQSLSELSIYDKDFNKARKYLNLAKPLIVKGTNIERKIQIYSVSSKLESAVKSYDKSIIQLDSAILLAQNFKLPNRLFPLYLRKAEIHKNLEQYQSAIEYYEKYNAIKDSLEQYKELSVIQENIAKYELKSREKTLKTYIENEKQLKSNLFIVGSISFVLLLGTIIFYWRYRVAKTKQKTIEKNIKSSNDKLEKLQQKLTSQKLDRNIKLKNNQLINCDELLFIKSDGHYLSIHIENRKTPIVIRQKLSELLSQLKDFEFIRVHRSYIVNTQKIVHIKYDALVIKPDIEIPFSRTYRLKLKENNHPVFSK